MESKKKGIGVVLVNYHTTEQIIKIAKMYDEFACIDRVVIVNNDTHIGEKQELKKIESTSIHVIFETENLGYSKGNNIGLRDLDNHNMCYAIISNSDIVVDEKTILSLISNLNDMPQFGALAPRMINSASGLVPLRAIPLGYKRLFLQVFISNLDKKTEHQLSVNEHGIVQQSFLPGSFFICKMEAILKCNMFDSNVFLYREEEILAERLKKKGYLVGVSNNTSFLHNHLYEKESFEKVVKGKKMEHISERYYFKKYLKASPIQMMYVNFFEFLYTVRWAIRHIIKNGW